MADPRIAKTRAALAEAVLALAAERPFADVTITEIAERAGVGYASFFRHYRDKDALLTEVADRLVDDLLAALMPVLLAEDTQETALAICRFVDTHRPICRALLAGGAETAVRRHIVARAITAAARQKLHRPAGIPQDLIITHSVSASLGLLTWWLEQGGAVAVETMAMAIDRLVLAPVRSLQAQDDKARIGGGRDAADA